MFSLCEIIGLIYDVDRNSWSLLMKYSYSLGLNKVGMFNNVFYLRAFWNKYIPLLAKLSNLAIFDHHQGLSHGATVVDIN